LRAWSSVRAYFTAAEMSAAKRRSFGGVVGAAFGFAAFGGAAFGLMGASFAGDRRRPFAGDRRRPFAGFAVAVDSHI
jgi:hypothetical protein